jgi:copper(I)-binding protein
MIARFIFTATLFSTFGFGAIADAYCADLSVVGATARATVAGQTSGGAYLSIENRGKTADRLLKVSSPVANSVELHNMSMDGNVMHMREVENIELKASEKLSMHPGDGYHLMLMGLKRPLKSGDKVPLNLLFEKAGKIAVDATVQDK